jgi:MerR family mercuric resistance operon transcriptional regulator
MNIGEAAQSSGCHLETIRYYERVGLLKPPRRQSNGYRHYSEGEVDRLRFISRSRGLGFTLDEIRSLLSLSDSKNKSCEEVDQIAREQLEKVEVRIRELRRIAKELKATIDACEKKSCDDCAILHALSGAA